MNRKLKYAAVAALAVIAALPLAAQTSRIYREGNTWVEEVTGSLPAAKVLKVNTQAGSVQVQGGTRRDIAYAIKKRVYMYSENEARRALQAFRVTALTRGTVALVEGDWEGGSPRKFSAEFNIQVPRELELARLSTDGGSMSVRNLAGRVEAESGGGSVQLADIGGAISAETGGGSVEVTNTPGELNLRTGGGAIRIAGNAGRVSAETGGGSIQIDSSTGALVSTGGGSIDVKECQSQLRASTGGGSIDVGAVNGAVILETGGGSIRLGGAKGLVTANTGAGSIELYKLMAGARAETGAGAIKAEFLGSGSGDSILQSSLGDVIVFLAPEVRFTVRAAIQMANGHKIRSDFPELKVTSEGGEWGPRNLYAEGVLNGGGPVLKIRTTSGNIEVRRITR